MTLLECRQLVVGYRKFTVGPIDISLKRGEMLALVGRNGAGKSTLILGLLGLRKALSGTVHIAGDVVDLHHPPTGVGALLQVPGVLPWCDAASNLRLIYPSDAVDDQRIIDVLDRVGLGDVGSKPVSSFSTGMGTRLALARAIVADPPLLILDEPTAGLDIDGVQWLASQLRGRAEDGAGVLVATHDNDLLNAIGAPMLHLQAGQIVEAPAVTPT